VRPIVLNLTPLLDLLIILLFASYLNMWINSADSTERAKQEKSAVSADLEQTRSKLGKSREDFLVADSYASIAAGLLANVEPSAIKGLTSEESALLDQMITSRGESGSAIIGKLSRYGDLAGATDIVMMHLEYKTLVVTHENSGYTAKYQYSENSYLATITTAVRAVPLSHSVVFFFLTWGDMPASQKEAVLTAAKEIAGSSSSPSDTGRRIYLLGDKYEPVPAGKP